MPQLSHFDESGDSQMVDVGSKDVTYRKARAQGYVKMEPKTQRLIRDKMVAKGDVFAVARLAAIMATKRTPELIPLCHTVNLDNIQVDFEVVDDGTVRIEVSVSAQGRTGVEMEALTAVSVAALTVYDMCKAVDRGISIGPIQLLEKSGGKSGHYVGKA